MSNSDFDFIIRQLRYLQENNYDALVLVDGPKGNGKSNLIMAQARRYVHLYGFICPKCGATFYLNCWKPLRSAKGIIKKDINNNAIWEIPKEIKQGFSIKKGKKRKVFVQCPIEYRLDLKTGEKHPIFGCGHKFYYKDRKIPKWDAKNYIAYDNKDVLDKIFNSPRYTPIAIDEMIKVVAAQNHNRSESKYLKEVLTVVRPKRFLILGAIPEMLWVDSKVREGMSTFWIRVLERGLAVLFEKDKGIADDHYHIKKMQKMMGAIFHNTDLSKIKKKLSKHPCYQMMFKVPNLPEKVYNNYEAVRNALTLQRQVEEATLSNKDMAKMAAFNLINFYDNIRLQVLKSKSNKMTYSILLNQIFKNPVTGKPVMSEPTARNWIKAVEDYVKSKGSEIAGFDGDVAHVKKDTNTNTNTNTKKRIKTIEVTDDNDAVIEMKLEDINDNDEIIQL